MNNMKKLVIVFICLMLLVGCKKDETAAENENKSTETAKPPSQETIINVNTGGFAEVNESILDSLNNKEVFSYYTMSIPDWKVDRIEDYVMFSKPYHVLLMSYNNEQITNKSVNNYKPANKETVDAGAFKAEREDGTVGYNGRLYGYVSYYINDDEISLKLTGITTKTNISSMELMIKTMIESLEREGIS